MTIGSISESVLACLRYSAWSLWTSTDPEPLQKLFVLPFSCRQFVEHVPNVGPDLQVGAPIRCNDRPS